MRGLKLKCSLVTTLSVCFFKYWMKQSENRRGKEYKTSFGIIYASSVALKDNNFNNSKVRYGFALLPKTMYLDYFRELLHPPPTRRVIPGFTLHAALNFLHANLPLPTRAKWVHNYISATEQHFRHLKTADKLSWGLCFEAQFVASEVNSGFKSWLRIYRGTSPW